MSDETRSTFQLSQDRQVLEARILAKFRDRMADYEYVLPYAELNKLVGGNVQTNTNLSSKVTGAMRDVAKQLGKGIALGRDPNRGGIVLIPPSQYEGYVDAKVGRIRRFAKRTATEAHRIAQHADLPPEDKQKVVARGALAGAIAAFSGKKAVGRIETAAKESGGEPLSLNRTLDAFRKQA